MIKYACDKCQKDFTPGSKHYHAQRGLFFRSGMFEVNIIATTADVLKNGAHLCPQCIKEIINEGRE
jgi:hypothetical protein